MREAFLRYEPAVSAEDAELRLKRARGALTASNASAEDIINALLPAQELPDGRVQFVSREPAGQLEVLQLEHQLQDQLRARQARETGLCPIRFQVYMELFDELIRQISLDCVERGLLLRRLKDQSLQEIRQKQLLYEQGTTYATEKMMLPEETALIARIDELETENAKLKR